MSRLLSLDAMEISQPHENAADGNQIEEEAEEGAEA